MTTGGSVGGLVGGSPVGVGSGSAVLPLPPAPVGSGVSVPGSGLPPLPLPSPLFPVGAGSGSGVGAGSVGVGGVAGTSGSGGSHLPPPPPRPQPLPLPFPLPSPCGAGFALTCPCPLLPSTTPLKELLPLPPSCFLASAFVTCPALPARSTTAIAQKTAKAARARATKARASYGSGWKGATCSTSAVLGLSLSGLRRPSQTFVHLNGKGMDRHRLCHSFQCKATSGFESLRTLAQ